jgi:hypothetical protein
MTEIQNPKQKKQSLCSGLEFAIWNLRFICNLVLGICDLRHQTPRQSRRTLTWPKGPGFSGQNKIACLPYPEGIYTGYFMRRNN